MFFRKKRKKSLSEMNPNEKMNYNENDLLDELHTRFFQSYALTLDTADYIPQDYIDKVYKRIYKAQKKQYKKVGKTDKRYQKWFIKRLPQLIAERQEIQKQLELEKLKNKDGSDGQKQTT